MKCKVYEITDTLLKYRMDTGLEATSFLADLMSSPKLYEAEVVIPGISYKLPIYDREGKTVIRTEVVSPFTLGTPNEINDDTFCVVDTETSEILSWDADSAFCKSKENAVLFKEKEFAVEYIRCNSSVKRNLVEKPYKEL